MTGVKEKLDAINSRLVALFDALISNSVDTAAPMIQASGTESVERASIVRRQLR